VAIISSTVTVEGAQVDGRFWVYEVHTDNVGLEWRVDYLADAGTNYNADATARAPILADQLRTSEIETNINMIKQLGALAVPTFNYSTKLQQAPYLREAYKTMTETEAVFAGEFLAGFTDAQLANAFNISLQQVANLRANKLTPAVATAADIRAAEGI
jgi:hypothetical protein